MVYLKLLDNNNDKSSNIDFDTLPCNNVELKQPLSADEVKKALNNLKVGKCPSTFDNILNEYIKYNENNVYLQLLCKLFNLVFESGIFPEVWSRGTILPMYKNKGNTNDPDNYRGIIILTCMGKLFTTLLNNRLTKSLDSYNVICEEQAGFRQYC